MMQATLPLRLAPSWLHCAVRSFVAVALALSAAAAPAAIIDIDTFANPNPGQFVVVPTGNNVSLAISQTVAGVIGGQRDVLFEALGQTVATPATALIGHDTNFNIDAFQLGTVGLIPTVATLQYSGTNNLNTSTSLVNAHNLGNVDLTSGGTNNRFEFEFYSSDALPSAGLDIVLTVTSPGGSSTASATAPNAQAPFVVPILFSQLVGTASLTQVDSITVKLNSVAHTPNIDFELHHIAAVPEPAGYFLMALGVAIAFTAGLARRDFAVGGRGRRR